jgi:hypothetical protein
MQRHRAINDASILEQGDLVDAIVEQLLPDFADPRLGIGLTGKRLVRAVLRTSGRPVGAFVSPRP